MDIISNKNDYLKEKGDINFRLSEAHKKEAEAKRHPDSALRKIYEDSDQYKEKLEKWQSDKSIFVEQKLPMTYILQKHREFEADVEEDFEKFKQDRTKKS